MRRVLIPTEIAPKVTLYEALAWVAFNVYSVVDYDHDGNDKRENTYYNDDAYINSDFVPELMLTDNLCKRFNLPMNYAIQYLKDGDRPPRSIYERWPDFDKNKETLSAEYIDTLESEQIEYEQFQLNQKPFFDAVNDCLEIPKSKLLIALREGSINAFGREILNSFLIKLKKDIDRQAIQSMNTEDLFAEHHDFPELESIEPKHWIYKNVDWDNSYFRNNNFAYCHILIDTESLFQVFPEPKEEATNVYSVNGTLLIDDDAPILKNIPNKKGRPSYNWKEFIAEMAKLLANGELPAMQKSCVIDMQEWCKKNWGVVPSETNLKENISPFYAAKRQSEIKSENKAEKQEVTF
jgi:hypothetical protein